MPDPIPQPNSWRPPPGIPSSELLVVAATDHFFGEDYGRNIRIPEEWALDLNCTFSTDRSLIADADAVWFHGPSLRERPQKRPGQKWILMSMESDRNYPFLRDPRIAKQFDLQMTYRLDSDIPTLYPNWKQYAGFQDAPLDFALKSSQPATVLYAASNPVEYRDVFVGELMQHLPVDSVGKCLHNRDINGFSSGTGWPNDGFRALLELIRQYKFYLALENSQTVDYVTEKVFMALAAGTVPVYLGASNARDFMPDDKAVIFADEFDSPADLAAHLRWLAEDEAAYARHLQWKQRGYSGQFRTLVDLSSTEPLLRMFVKLAHGCDRNCRCGGRLR